MQVPYPRDDLLYPKPDVSASVHPWEYSLPAMVDEEIPFLLMKVSVQALLASQVSRQVPHSLKSRLTRPDFSAQRWAGSVRWELWTLDQWYLQGHFL